MQQQISFRTAESVSPKHPDKLCDQISDAILDTYLSQDPDARVAIEVTGGHGVVYISGEISAKRQLSINNYTQIVHQITGDPGLRVATRIEKQSPYISQGVDTGGAGDQGIMVGYACDETPELLPIEVVLARKLNQAIYARFPYDGKTQITIRYSRNIIDPYIYDKNSQNQSFDNAPAYAITSVVASFQNTTRQELKQIVDQFMREHNLPLDVDIKYLLNPAGDWNIGSFNADTGLTGRKLVIDNYGPRIPIGGGCFSGKDASKVDRSAAYMARKIAVDYLQERHAREVIVRLAYAIGSPNPIEKSVIIDGVAEEIKLSDSNRMGSPKHGYNLTPETITKVLHLKKPQFINTATYGHFGHDFIWDK